MPERIPDEVPVADAVEQSTPAVDDPEAAAVESAAEIDGQPPLESDESDWQEQRLTVDLDPEEGFR